MDSNKLLTVFNKVLDGSRKRKLVNLGVELVLVDILWSSVNAFPDNVPNKALEAQDSTVQSMQIFQLDLNEYNED